jgi:thiamine biosynthesis protein ThiS
MNDRLQFQLNGRPHEAAAGATLADLLVELNLSSDGVAIALDRRVIPRGAHAQTVVPAGASVEIIRAVGGG